MKIIDKIKYYTRKEVADQCGVSTQTIRLWEEAGVIPAPKRMENGWRFWDEETTNLIIEYSSKSRKERYGNVAGKHEDK